MNYRINKIHTLESTAHEYGSLYPCCCSQFVYGFPCHSYWPFQLSIGRFSFAARCWSAIRPTSTQRQAMMWAVYDIANEIDRRRIVLL